MLSILSPRALRAAATLVATAGAAALPAAAQAATVSVSGATLTYVAGSGETNSLTIERLSTGFRVTDTGAPLAAGAGCQAAGAHAATCGLGSVTLLRATLGAGEDTARVIGTTAAALSGGAGTDQLTGGSGRDTLDAGTGNGDRLIGGAGMDRLVAEHAGTGASLSGGADADTLIGNSAAPSSGNPYYYSSYARLEGGPGNDTLEGSSQGDTLDGGTGADTIRGNGAMDAVVYTDRTEPVVVDVTDALATDGGASDAGVVDGQARRDLVTGVEGLAGGSGDDVLTVGDGDNQLVGGAGRDTLNGGAGNDRLCGDGSGLPGAGGGCHVASGPGDDTLNGGDGDDHLDGVGGADALNGGDGRDTASWSIRTTRVVATIEDRCSGAVCAAPNDGAADTDPDAAGAQPEGDTVGLDVENLVGGGGDDSLTGTAAANELGGNLGADTLTGGGGDDVVCGDGVASTYLDTTNCTDASYYDPGGKDTLNGGAGDDLLSGGTNADVMNGGADEDTVSYAARGWALAVTIEDTCTTGTGTAYACARANDGQLDADQSTAGNQPEGDKVGIDVENLIGGYAGDTLSGGAGANELDGDSGADVLSGLGGNDLLVPGRDGYSNPGGNTLNGGRGIDSVSYRHAYNGVFVTIDGLANDGVAGGTDNVRTDVEGVVGSSWGDSLTGNPSVAAPEILLGGGGDDLLDGNGGDDALTGGAGADTLRGDGGNDALDSADGAADTVVECGLGTGDRVVFDADLDAPAGCETQSAVAEGGAR